MARQPHSSFMTLWGALLAGTVLPGIVACGDAVPAVCGDSQMSEVSRLSKVSRLSEVGSLWQCGPTLDFTPINSYRGKFANVQDREDAVVLINGSCTGTLIEAS